MNTNPLVSIIIPVYNVLPYLKQCLDSVKDQLYENWECIIVDDGSTDGCADYIDEYIKNDNRFSVIHKKNEGLANARCSGLLKAIGKYVVHLDSDDYIEQNHVAAMVKCAERENADIVLADYYVDSFGKQELVHQEPISLDVQTLICDVLEARHHAGLWCKLFKRSVIIDNSIPPAPYSYYEDMFSYISFLLYAKNIAYVPIATYHYRFNQQSMTNTQNIQRRISTYEQCMQNLEALVLLYSFEENSKIMRALYKRVNGEKERLLIFSYKNSYHINSSLMKHFPLSYTILQPISIREKLIYHAIKDSAKYYYLLLCLDCLCDKFHIRRIK